MRACKQCGLSIGDTATFCPVCGALADPADALPATAHGSSSPEPATAPASRAAASPVASPPTPSGLEAEARACEKIDAARAVALYRQAIVERLESGEDLLTAKPLRRDVQRLFDRLSLVLKRAGLTEEALEEIETAAYLGLVDDETCGTKAQREALVKRREALRGAVRKTARV